MAFIKRHNLQGYNFDGRMFGVRDSHGELMRKSWHICTNLHELACLEQYMCTHDHTHGQSRGKSLKSAEGYTFAYTDLVHRCFKHSNSSRSAAVTQRALPVIVADPIMSADQEMRRETLEIFESHFRQIVASGYYLEDGYSEDVDAVLNGVLGQHTAHSVLAGLEKNPWLEPELGPLIRTPKEVLATFTGVPSKVVRQHDQNLGLEVDEDGYADLDEVARCFGLNHSSAPPLTVKDLIAIAAKDQKNRFEFLGVREGHKLEEKGVALWPLKMRAAAGQSKHAIKSAQDNYRSAALVYCSPSLRPEAKAPFIGKPIANVDQIPLLAFHRTRPACWKRIIKEGLIQGGGEFVGSDRAHVYLAANRITETDYQSGLRGKHPIQLTIALKEAVDSGLIFSRTAVVAS